MTASHIVLVDDETDLREPVAEYLREHGLDISEADGGVQFDAILAERPVTVAVLDVTMPGEDGFSIARRLRARFGEQIGIIMLTARRDLVDRVVGLELGADDYMMKPFEPRELLARIRSVVRRVGEPVAAADDARPPLGLCPPGGGAPGQRCRPPYDPGARIRRLGPCRPAPCRRSARAAAGRGCGVRGYWSRLIVQVITCHRNEPFPLSLKIQLSCSVIKLFCLANISNASASLSAKSAKCDGICTNSEYPQIAPRSPLKLLGKKRYCQLVGTFPSTMLNSSAGYQLGRDSS